MDIYDIIDNIYKLPLASKEALLNETPEVPILKVSTCFWQTVKVPNSI